MRGESVLYSIFGVAIALTALLILYPAYHALELSFQDLDSFISKPVWIGLKNYTDVLAMPEFWAALGRGLIFSGVTIALQIVLGIGFAMLLDAAIPAKPLVRGLAVLPYLLPTIIVALTFQWMLDSTVGVFTQGVRLFGYSYIPVGREQRRGHDRRHRAQRVDLDTLRDPRLPGGTAGGAGRALRGGPGRRRDRLAALLAHHPAPAAGPCSRSCCCCRAIWMFNKFDIIWLTTRGGTAARHRAPADPRLSQDLRALSGRSGRRRVGDLVPDPLGVHPDLFLLLPAGREGTVTP